LFLAVSMETETNADVESISSQSSADCYLVRENNEAKLEIGHKHSLRVTRGRILVVLVLVICAIIVSVLTYRVVHKGEEGDFHTQVS
jgi:hypothetical protein